MGAAPNKCPMCGEMIQWKLVDTSNKGFSVGKAAVGAGLLGPVGLLLLWKMRIQSRVLIRTNKTKKKNT